MRNLIICILLTVFSCSVFIQQAEAARFGGGRSFGVQRSHSSLFSKQRSYTSKPFNQPKANPTRKWGGFLGGLLIGGLLTSLFMGHGLGTGILTWILLGAAVFFLMSWFKRRFSPAFQTTTSHAFQQQKPFQASANWQAYTSPSENFDTDGFLRDAKVTFIRLQRAYDSNNLADLKEFTAPDVFAEIQMQLNERGNTSNSTDVKQIDAELLDISKQAIGTMASVRFTGLIQENQSPASSFEEIWHFQRFASNQPWLVAGIQQDVYMPE